MPQCADESVALTVTSPPYWNAIDYDVHASNNIAYYRNRNYTVLGDTYEEWLLSMAKAFMEVYRVTMQGGYCAVVIGTILHNSTHYPAPFDVADKLRKCGFQFQQDIIWNKVTGGVRRAGSFIQNPRFGYYYPNIMTEYILVFRKGSHVRRGEADELAVDELFKRDIANNVWHIAPVPPKTIDHPCPYPDELVRRLILLYSQPGDTVLDPFLGSGQTARIALKHDRHSIGYEIESYYLKVAYQRLREPIQREYQLLPKYDRHQDDSGQYELDI